MFSGLIFEPVQKIQRSYYLCDSRFHLEEIIPMYDNSLAHRVDGAVYVDGSKCVMSFIQDNRMKVVDQIDIRLISQFKNGGQSANRLERIVDENRSSFVKKVVEMCIDTFYDKKESSSKISNLIIYGPSRFKNDVDNHDKPKLSKYFESITLFTTQDAYQIDDILEHLSEMVDPKENTEIIKIRELIALADGKIVFGDEIMPNLKACMLEKLVITVDQYAEIIDGTDLPYSPEIIIVRGSLNSTFLEMYGGIIGVKWY